MKTNNAILVAILVVLVIIVAFMGGCWLKGRDKGCDGFTNGQYNPYTVLNKQLDEIRGYRNDGFRQTPFYRLPRGLDRYHRAGAQISPEMVAEAEREQWYGATSSDNSGQFNTELTQEPASDTVQYHTASPAIDYGAFVTDLVVDPRTRDNHQRWVEEMKPWSGTAMAVDDLDMENYVDFQGLRRPQAVVQYNPLQLTEIDTFDLAKNKKFNFQG